MDDLFSRSYIKTISEFIAVTWYSGSEISVLLKVHVVCGKQFTAIPTALAHYYKVIHSL